MLRHLPVSHFQVLSLTIHAKVTAETETGEIRLGDTIVYADECGISIGAPSGELAE